MYFSIIEDKKPRQSLTHVAAADHIPMNYGNAYSKAKAFEVSLTRLNKYSVFLNWKALKMSFPLKIAFICC